MSFKQHAKDLARKGFRVFPLFAGLKKPPLIKDFANHATTDEKQIDLWWGKWPNANIGISTEGLIVVDVDNKGETKGDEEILRLEIEEGRDFPETYEQRTPTGGRHLVYRYPDSVKQGAHVLGRGLDIRSRGGYIVGAGSRTKRGVYTGSSVPVRDAPEWLPQSCGGRVKPKVQESEIKGSVDSVRAEARASEFLLTAKVSVEGNGGDQQAFITAAQVKDFGVSEASCLELMLGHWNPRCQPPWSREELEKKVSNAYRYGNEPPGIAAPENLFEPIEPKQESETDLYLEQVNKEFAIIFEDGGHSILQETVDEKGNKRIKFMPEITFRRKFSDKKVQLGDKSVSWAIPWLDWPGRRVYQGVCFAPEREARNGYYNLWQGFKVKATPYEQASKQAQAGFDAFIDHAKRNICSDSPELFRWLMGYFAHLIQKPYERPLTTVVFQGSKGVGKNAFIDRIGTLLGSKHYLVAHNQRYLTSNFNGHMDACLCLVLDEAFWSGDKSAEGQLKGLTTSPTTMIERKGKDPYVVDNLARIIIIGNEDWLVPASTDERRYAVFEIAEGNKKDNPFFEAMRINCDQKGGNEIILHYLKNYDISNVQINVAPITKALLEQKLSTQESDPIKNWWLCSLKAGKLLGYDFAEGWTDRADKALIRSAVFNFSKANGHTTKYGLLEELIGKKLKRLCPPIDTTQKRTENRKRINEYRFPPLSVCREEFEKSIGHKMEWEDQ